MERTPKAIALMSGGLDSTLAARIVRDQGVEVVGLHLSSPFACRSDLESAAQSAGVRLIIREKGEAYMDLIRHPRFGRGRNMNPCLDCRIFMFEYAEKVREEEGADFVITGEVVGQRPMSQQRKSMNLIDRHSPLEDRILRPLSAHRFPPSLPEKEGWVDREKLFGISGRSRREQIDLARELGIVHYEAPGGGCLLTQASFTNRLRDYFEHDDDVAGPVRLARAELISVGRHFRVSEKVRAIVARREEENARIEKYWGQAEGTLFRPADFKGPAVVALGSLSEEELQKTAQLVVRYGKKDGAGPRQVEMITAGGSRHMTVEPNLSESQIQEMIL